MGDTGEVFRLYKEQRKKKKETNIENSTNLLKKEGIEFESKNCGVHLIVKCSVIIDFWPSTGKWISRAGKQGNGVRNLLKYIQKLNPVPKARPDIPACNPKI